MKILRDFDFILLDMNGAFMFGHDRFGPEEDYGANYQKLGGTLPKAEVDAIIRAVYEYLETRYSDPAYQECFPGVREALDVLRPDGSLPEEDRQRLVETFAHHERGVVLPEYAEALLKLSSSHRLGLVTDIWAPKGIWLEEFARAGISEVFSAMSFSSDHGHVKPSPKPFLDVLDAIGADSARTVVIGDSVRRDLAGATAAGLPCILVGGAGHSSALATAGCLLDLL